MPNSAQAQGQLSVRVQPILVGQHIEGAVHRPELVLLRFNRHRVKHVVSIEIKVARGLPQVEVGNMGRVEQVITRPQMGVAPVVLKQQPHSRPLWVPEYQPAPPLLEC